MELNHHIMAKEATDAILSKFINGNWKCCKNVGTNFYRTNTFADFPSPDATFVDEGNKILVSFEFKPPTETKRGILTGLGQAIAYLERATISYLIVPKTIEDFDMESYMKDIFTKLIKDKLPVGLIIYTNNNPSNVTLAVNVVNCTKNPISINSSKNNRYWAKHQDMPLPLFFLILHFYYLKQVGMLDGDAYEACWKKHMISPSILDDLELRPVIDLKNNPIRTMMGEDYICYNKGIIKSLKKEGASNDIIREEIKKAIATSKPDNTNGKWDNNYRRVRRYLLAFFKQINVIDSNDNITTKGLKLHQIGLTNGPESKLFKDYFTKEILITGCHFDLIVDFDKMFRNRPFDIGLTTFLEEMEKKYEEMGYIKRNPGRKVDNGNKKPFLDHERTLWKYLDLMDNSYNFNWKRIMEVCSLPNL